MSEKTPRPSSRLRVYPVWVAAAAELFEEILGSPLAADAVVRRFFRRHREMGKRDRGFVTEVAYGVLRWWRRLAHAAGERAQDRPFLVLLYLKVFGFGGVELDLPVGAPELEALEAAALRFRNPPLPDDPRRSIGIAYSLPDWLVATWLEVLPREAVEARCAALNEPGPLVLRVNTLKADRESVRQQLLEEGFSSVPAQYSPVGLLLEEKGFVYRTEAFRRGLFEVQDEGSQLISLLTEAEPDQVVVDACAGGGGKTLHLAALMRSRGDLYASDVRQRALRELERRARRAGARNIRIIPLTGAGPSNAVAPEIQRLQGKADAVLVDAPCSGTGVLRRNPEVAWKLTPQLLAKFTEEQARILANYAPLVRPGGRLVYATCSLLPQENEHRVRAFLEQHPDFSLVPAPEVLARQGVSLPGQTDAFLRLEPASVGTDGFFAAVLVRSQR